VNKGVQRTQLRADLGKYCDHILLRRHVQMLRDRRTVGISNLFGGLFGATLVNV
jgi:hypothetical protein